MSAVIHLSHLLDGELRVFLRGGKPLMSQQLLDGAQVGPFRQHVRAKGMAQGMWMDVRRQPPGHRNLLYDSRYAARGERTAPAIDEQPPRALARLCQDLAPGLEIKLQGFFGFAFQRRTA